MKKNTLLVLLVIFLFSNKFFGQNTNIFVPGIAIFAAKFTCEKCLGIS